jgi:hypothetical protein
VLENELNANLKRRREELLIHIESLTMTDDDRIHNTKDELEKLIQDMSERAEGNIICYNCKANLYYLTRWYYRLL